MTPENKERMIAGVKVLSLIVFAFIAIIANVGLWNAASTFSESVEPFVMGVSVANFLFEGVGIFKLVQHWFPKKVKK